MRYKVPLLVASLLALSSVGVFAYRDTAVLGTTTEVTDAVFPPVTSGPGHILPDSPLYFLDKLYQDFRLALVFTPANRAQLHMAIAGERMAELRVESARNNQAGVDTALTELEHEVTAASDDVRDAASQGQDVTQLARDIHQAMTDYRNDLVSVEAQVPDTAYEQKLATASDVIWEARTLTEDALPEGDLKHEMMANAQEELDEAVLGISTATTNLQNKISIYEKVSSGSADKTTVTTRLQQIAQLKAKIAQLQAELDRLLLLQAQLSKESTASKAGTVKPTVTVRKISPTPTTSTHK
ncbi:MAG TPA: DUF5667 domain-containing protein [Patescibacteria group bacterium]|nr:DUF5667 domain-containing protein [Patescibacteria group bacterium]